MTDYCFEVKRTNLAESRLLELTPMDDVQLSSGEVLLDIEKFSLTANNITYGVAGDLLGYWQFFPAEGDYGCIPVWAIGRVVASEAEGVTVGQRFYGYYPMASYLKIHAAEVSSAGLVDASPHRAALPKTYNQYMHMTPDYGFVPEQDDQQLLYRPLFTTAFLIDDFFADNDFFAASTVVIASASSKTAYATAHCMAARSGLNIVALTSPANKAFVEGLGVYDKVYCYDDVEAIDAQGSITYVDMSGNRQLLARVHKHFDAALSYSCAVGITHYDATEGDDPATLPGATPIMFFAPTQLEKRNKEWGAAVVQTKLAGAWNSFLLDVGQHIEISHSKGSSGITDTFNTVLNGARPDQAYICET